ncbi:MAG: GrpB family protein [Cyanobacteria bacterium P01_D01_bin.115]
MDEVVITEYDPRWPSLFARESTRLRTGLPPHLITRIEHFGSTAVLQLAAKPIIDLLVGVRSLAIAQQVTMAPLAQLGYAYWHKNPDPRRLFFVKGLPPNGPRTHHVHMVEPHSPLWERLRFRDDLCQHADETARYAQLKYRLAQDLAGDREAYTRAKADYIESVMQKVRQQSVR